MSRDLTDLKEFPSFFSDFWGTPDNFFNRDSFWPGKMSKVPAANVKEIDKAFVIELAAPGLKKEDFQIHIENGMVSISVESRGGEQETAEHYTRKEYSYQSFNRSFGLPDTVNQEGIKASYIDGVLKVYLPKKEATVSSNKRTIDVS